MKRIIALSMIAALLPGWALARGNHPMAGCGLGYLLLSNRDNEKVTQVLGATTNGTFGTQTFGISSGTSGCTEDGAVKIARATEVFVDVNLDSLRREIAAGEGEYVNTLASLLGASEITRPEMVRFLHSEYQALFPAADTTSMEVLNNLAQKLAGHPELLG
jgi:hypothetical protein